MGTPRTNVVHSYRKSCHRRNDPGHAHAFTFSCFRRQPFLTSDRSRGWLATAIDTASTKHTFDVWAYVFMPEHVHLLIYPLQREYSVSAILSSIKQSVAKRAVNYVRRNDSPSVSRMEDVRPSGTRTLRFWQRGGGYDRNLTSPGYIWETIDYIHRNPVRRGLCGSPGDWIWSSWRSYEERYDGPIPIGYESLPDRPMIRGGIT